MFWFRQTKAFPHYRAIQGVLEIRLVVHDDEVKEGLKLRVPVPFGGLAIVLCEYFKELEDLFTANGGKVSLSKKLLEVVQQVSVAYGGVWFKV